MLEELISETRSRHSNKPISPEVFHKWRQSTVTKRLFEDLELAVIDSFQDYLSEDSQESAIMQAMLRQGGMQMADQVIEWRPAGLEVDDED